MRLKVIDDRLRQLFAVASQNKAYSLVHQGNARRAFLGAEDVDGAMRSGINKESKPFLTGSVGPFTLLFRHGRLIPMVSPYTHREHIIALTNF
jgi:hypothetical protein